MLKILLLSAAMSIDALGLGISLGVRKIKMSAAAAAAVSLTGFAVIALAMLAGEGIFYLLPDNAGRAVSSIILIIMGLWIIVQSCEKPDKTGSRTVKIVRSPVEGDIDRSGTIDRTEAFFLGLALSLDSIGICIGAGNMQSAAVLPIAAMLAQLVFMTAGITIGNIIGKNTDTKICTVLSGAVIIIIGIMNI